MSEVNEEMFWLFESSYIYAHALLKSEQWFSIYKKPKIYFVYEQAKRSRAFFGKVFLSKKFERGIKNRTKTNIIFTPSEKQRGIKGYRKIEAL